MPQLLFQEVRNTPATEKSSYWLAIIVSWPLKDASCPSISIQQRQGEGNEPPSEDISVARPKTYQWLATGKRGKRRENEK